MKKRTVDWQAIKGLAEQGIAYGELAARFKVSLASIKQRAHREQWVTPKRLEAKIQELKSQRDAMTHKDEEKADLLPLSPVDIVAQTWVR
jgi:hypothetical protein